MVFHPLQVIPIGFESPKSSAKNLDHKINEKRLVSFPPKFVEKKKSLKNKRLYTTSVENVHEMTGRNFVQYGQRHLVNFSYAAGVRWATKTRELKIRTQSNSLEQFWKLRKTGTMINGICFVSLKELGSGFFSCAGTFR